MGHLPNIGVERRCPSRASHGDTSCVKYKLKFLGLAVAYVLSVRITFRVLSGLGITIVGVLLIFRASYVIKNIKFHLKHKPE